MTVKTASLHGLGHTDTPTDHTARELPGNKPTQRAVQGQASSPLGRTQPGETDEATAARQAVGTKNAQDRLGGNFAKLGLAQGASNLGDGVQVTALPLLAATLTRDPLPVSAVMFAKWLPWLLFGLLAGALLDRWDRRDVDARMADFARRSGLPAERAARLAAPQRAGRWRVAIALAGLTALAIAAVAFSPAVLAPERPGAAAFAVQPMVGGKVRARLDGSLDGPEVRRELARALQQHGINVKFLLIPGLERLAGRVLSKDHTRPLSEFTYDRAQLEPGAEQVPGVVNVTVYIAVGVTQQP